jgi:hypothetical protein
VVQSFLIKSPALSLCLLSDSSHLQQTTHHQILVLDMCFTSSHEICPAESIWCSSCLTDSFLSQCLKVRLLSKNKAHTAFMWSYVASHAFPTSALYLMSLVLSRCPKIRLLVREQGTHHFHPELCSVTRVPYPFILLNHLRNQHRSWTWLKCTKPKCLNRRSTNPFLYFRLASTLSTQTPVWKTFVFNTSVSVSRCD